MKNLKRIVQNLKEKFLDEVFPPNVSCYNCNNEIKNKNPYSLCEECLKEIKPIKYPCKICGDELNSFTEVCDNCKNNKRYFDYVSSVTIFSGVAKNLVYKLKYGDCAYTAKTIAEYLASAFNGGKYEAIDIVTCVPISSEKLKIRGYNQTEEILKEFIKYVNIPCSASILKRVKDTITQTALTKTSRQENLQSAFEVVEVDKIKNKNVLVIDDVITTGSTLDAIAKALKEKGANKVYGLTFCHTKLNT